MDVTDEQSLKIAAAVQRAADAILAADALLITAGAGMGVDSGLPDFRGQEGFWKAYPPFAKLNLRFEQMSCPATLASNPELFWGFYGHRHGLYRKTQPHAGFQILRKWAITKPGGYFVFTSNVDGHFQRAGFAEDRVVECHGSLNFLQCAKPCTSKIWSADDLNVSVDESTMLAAHPLPRCENCAKFARPNVLMFSDFAWTCDRTHEQENRYRRWRKSLPTDSRLVVVECGAGTAIPTVQYEGDSASDRTYGKLIRINPRDADVAPGHISLPIKALAALRLIDEQIMRGT